MRLPGLPVQASKIRNRIHRSVVHPKLKMEVRPRSSSSRPYVSDQIIPRDMLARLHIAFPKMTVTRHSAKLVIYHHNIPVTGSLPGKDYGTVRGRDNPASIGSRDVYSRMIVYVGTVKRVLPRAESACYVSAHRQERRGHGQQKRPLRVELLQLTVSPFELA